MNTAPTDHAGLRQGDPALLDTELAQRLLAAPIPARMAFVALGQPADEIDQFHRHPHDGVDIGFTGTGFSNIEDVPCVGGGGRRVAVASQPVA